MACVIILITVPSHAGKLRLKHEQGEHWVECSKCTYIFKDEESLADHEDEAHPQNYCEECQRQFQNLNNLNQHLKSSFHVGKNAKCPWCSQKFTNLTGICLHLESGSCSSGINREKINKYCRQVDPGHIFTNKQIGWYNDHDKTPDMATGAAWDGSRYRCYLCQNGFGTLRALNQHLSSPAHQQKIYHCPRCRREYVALSGLINHLESESCGAFRFSGNTVGLGFVNQLRLTH